MRIHAILGPTGSGKTAAAVAIAAQTGAPVVALDRFQCFRELSVLSSRPSETELRGTRRIYLDDRRVTDGELSPVVAREALERLVVELSRRENLVILEGVSVSLIDLLAADPASPLRRATVEIREVNPLSQEFHDALRGRAMAMVSPAHGGPSLIEEVTAAWRQVDQRKFLATISGVDSLLCWCERTGIELDRLEPGALGSWQLREIAALVAESHLRDAFSQIAAIDRAGYWRAPSVASQSRGRARSRVDSDNQGGGLSVSE